MSERVIDRPSDGPTDGGPTDGGAGRRRVHPAWWVGGTLAAIVALAIALVIGLVLGIWIGRASVPAAGVASGSSLPGTGLPGTGLPGTGLPGTGLPDGGGSADPEADGGLGVRPTEEAGGTVGDGLDSCLVGTWRSTQHQEVFAVPEDQGGGTADVTGIVRTLEFTADGTETVSYDEAQGTLTVQGQPTTIVYDGTVTYSVATDGDQLTFELTGVDATITSPGEDGTPQTRDLQPASGPVTYSCDTGTLRQEAPGFESVYERVG